MKFTEYLHHWENIVFAIFILVALIQLYYYLFSLAVLPSTSQHPDLFPNAPGFSNHLFAR